jgi:iron complex outermembrane receptor protein
MQNKHLLSHTALPCAIVAALSLSPVFAYSQEQDDQEEEVFEPAELRRVVVTGTRARGQAPTETLSPIDLIFDEAFTHQANFDLTDGLSKIAPSFDTQRFPIADGTSFIRPVTLRNLSPDHTLVLINGTRRHRSALVNLQLAPLGTVNQGSQGVDFATIPAAAIGRVEVLRDGASAQYGSDAIAGVVNIILKDANEGGSITAQGGEYFDGDGRRTQLSANAGFFLGPEGFVNTTVERATSDITSRGVARQDAAFVASVIGADQVPLNGLGQRWGDPDVEANKLFVNAGLPIARNMDLYSYFNYADIKTISDFFYREPVLDPEHEFTARRTLQIDDEGNFMPDPAPQSLVDEIIAAGLDPNDYLMPDTDSPSGYVLRNPIYTMFPGGYNPDFGADITDYSLVVGLRGVAGNDWRWDVRGRHAENKVSYLLSETINPSLGRLSPTSFRPGRLAQQETSLNLDLVRPIEVEAFAAPLNLAFGVEYRDETYKITEGDLASRAVGPTAAYFGLGSDGFQGFPTEAAGSFSSESWAGYVDFETNLTEQFSGSLALRLEDYDTFGSTFDWKLSGRYDFTDRFAFRATADTGFRAPTPGQIHTLNVTTTADPDGNLIPSGTYPVAHPVARALGARDLDPETSNSYTAGIVYRPLDNTSVTLDYYNIKIKDRLALQTNVIGPDEVERLEEAGVEDANLLLGSVVNFFTNAYESNVSGVDLAVRSHYNLGPGRLVVDARHNLNEQKVRNVTPDTINQSRIFDLENQVPNNRTTLTFNYTTGPMFASYLRLNRYGGWATTGGLFSPGDASDVNRYSSKTLVDIEASFTFANNYEISIGGDNIFDTLPDREQNPVLQFLGVEHAITSPFGFNGAFWYVRVAGRF